MYRGETVNGPDAFSIQFYIQTAGQLARRPGAFFADHAVDTGWAQPLGFLLISGLIHATAGLTQSSMTLWLAFSLLLANALITTMVAALAACPAVMLLKQNHVPLVNVFSIYAYAAGLTLLVSWLPSLLWFGEITKWVLVGVGLVKALDMKRWQALVVVVASFAITVFVFLFMAGLARNF
jgi:hypothetical protein